MEATDSSEMSVSLYLTLWYNITEHNVINLHASYIVIQFCVFVLHLIAHMIHSTKSSH